MKEICDCCKEHSYLKNTKIRGHYPSVMALCEDCIDGFNEESINRELSKLEE